MRKITTVPLSIWAYRYDGKLRLGPRFLAVCCLLLFSASPLGYAQSGDWQRSYSLEAVGDYAKAAKVIEAYLQQEDSAEFAQLRSGWLYYLDANYSRSIKHYQIALKLNPKSLEARLGLTLPLLAQQRWREAAKYSKEVISASQWNYYAHIRLMICEEGLQLWDTLQEHAQTLVARYPSDPGILVYLARAYDHKGDTKKASAVYRQVLTRMPQHLEASQYLEDHK